MWNGGNERAEAWPCPLPMDRVSDRKINWRVPPWRVQLECKSYLRFGSEYSSGGKWPLKARQIQEVKDRIELFDCRKSSDSGPRNFGPVHTVPRTTKALGKSNQVNPASRLIRVDFFSFFSFLFFHFSSLPPALLPSIFLPSTFVPLSVSSFCLAEVRSVVFPASLSLSRRTSYIPPIDFLRVAR